MGWGPGGAFPGTSLVCARQWQSFHPHSLPFPNPLLCPPCSLNYFFPDQWLDSPPCLPKGGNSYLPHLPLAGGSLPSQLAGSPMSTQMGHPASDLGPAGGKRRALGTALRVTLCRAVLPNQKHVGHLRYPSLGAPGDLSKGIPPLLGQDTEGPIPAGSVQVQVAASKA